MSACQAENSPVISSKYFQWEQDELLMNWEVKTKYVSLSSGNKIPSLLVRFTGGFVSFSTCLGLNLFVYNQPVDTSPSYVFYILTHSTSFLSSLKCPRNAFSTHLLLFKESIIAKHNSCESKEIYWNTLLGFPLFQTLVHMCSVCAPSHNFFSE